MHEHAELGVAAHWTYKEGGSRDAQYERKIEWVRQLLEPQDTSNDERPRLPRAHAHGAVRRSRLCADAEGRSRRPAPRRNAARLRLPRAHRPWVIVAAERRSTAASCRSTYTLQNGEIVEIITGKQEAPEPRLACARAGLSRSARSRAKVRAWFRKQEAEQPSQAGVGSCAPLRKRVLTSRSPPSTTPRQWPLTGGN